MAERFIYHMCRREEWQAATETGVYFGSTQDVADGYIHFSTVAQIAESAARHRTGQHGLVLLAADPEALGAALKWEASRDGALFPHLHGALPVRAVRWVKELPLGDGGRHVFPVLE